MAVIQAHGELREDRSFWHTYAQFDLLQQVWDFLAGVDSSWSSFSNDDVTKQALVKTLRWCAEQVTTHFKGGSSHEP
eukprot:SAG31_NODE_32397_length_356_cov_1.000000_1_plen_76_part_10